MTDFRIDKRVEGDDVFTIVYTKEVKDVDDNEVTIVDHIEDVTIKQLEEKKEGLQKQIADIQVQIADIDGKIKAMVAV